MKVADFRQLGMLPLQDHRDLAPEFRTNVQCGRIETKDVFGGYQVEGHQESGSDLQTLGDLLGGFFWPQQDTGQREQGAWWFAGPCVTTEASRKDTEEKSSTQTRTRADAEKSERRVLCRPVHGLDWSADERFGELEITLHPDAPNLPKGAPIIVLPTSKESKQQLLGFPASSNVLIAANKAGDPALSSIVYDLTAEDEIDDDRNAFLHTFWRVAKLGGGCNLGTNDTLVWQLGRSGLDKLDGRGLVMDTGGVPAALSPSAPAPGSVEAQDGPTGSSQHGAVTTLQDFLKQLYDNLAGARSNPTGMQVGGVTVGGKQLGQTKERPKQKSQTQGGDPTQARPPAGVAAGGGVLASVSARSSGPIDVGDAADVHRIGTTKDGESVNAAHIACTSLFRNEVGDGPLDFESAAWEEPEYGGPFLSPVHLRWDPSSSHEWACGTAPGRWRWESESFFFIPFERTTSLPWIDPRTPKPPEVPSIEPPKQCQTTPGGGGNLSGGGDLGGGGGLDTDLGPDYYDLGGNPTGDVLVSAGAGSTGQSPTSNSGSTFTIPGAGPIVSGLLDIGIGVGSAGEQVSGSASQTPGSRPSTGATRTRDTQDQLDGTGAKNSGGGMVPGSEPRQPGAKADTDQSDLGQMPWWREGDTGSGRVGAAAAAKGTGEATGSVGKYLASGVPIGGLTVFGGGALSPAVQAALKSEEVIDEFGRLQATPPPRVGDSLVTRRSQLGGLNSRHPTAAQTMGFGSGVKFGAYATAAGQVDFSRGGWIQSDIGLMASAGNVASLVGFGFGNGTWEDLQAPQSAESIPGGLVFGPPELTAPETLQHLFNGDYTSDAAATRYPQLTESRLYLPGNLSQLYFAHPDAGATNGTTGQGGVRITHTSTGMSTVALTSTGADSPTSMLFGEGGLNVTGNATVTGKLTVGGLIDPTGLVLEEQASDPMSGTQVGIYAGDTAGANEAWWRRDDGTRVNLAATGNGGLIDSDSAAEATQSVGTTAIETLKTLSLPAGTLAADGDIVVFRAGGRVTASVGAGNRQALFRFGGSAFSFMVVAASGSETRWTAEAKVIRTGATAQTIITSGSASTVAQAQHLRGNAAETLSGAIACSLQGQDANSEDTVACDYFYALQRTA